MGFALASANPSMMLQFSWLDELLWYSQPHFLSACLARLRYLSRLSFTQLAFLARAFGLLRALYRRIAQCL